MKLSNNPNTLIHLGFLGKTHGLAGEITFYPMHRKDCQLHAKMEVFLKKDASDKFEPHSLEKLRWSSQFALVSFQKLTGIDLVKPYQRSSLYVSRDALEALPEGEFYLCDTLGMDVYGIDSNQLVGVVQSFYFNHAEQSIMVILCPDGTSVDVLVEPFVKKVDLKLRRCYITLPEYE